MPTALVSQPELQTRDITARTLSLRAKSIVEEDRSFEAVVSTETPVVVMDMRSWEPIEETLVARGGSFPERAPLLDNHNRSTIDDILGTAVDFRQEGDVWLARGILDDDGDRATRAFNKIKRGILDSVSIGYQIFEYVDIAPGSRKNIGGKVYQAKGRTLRVTTQWEMHELSLTPIPADKFTKVRNQQGNIAQPIRSYFR